MKRKLAKKYFHIEDTFMQSNLSQIALKEEVFNEKKSQLAKKAGVSKEAMENTFSNLDSFDRSQLYEIIDFDGKSSEESKALFFILENDLYQSFSDEVEEDINEDDIFKKEIYLHYSSLSNEDKEKFDSFFEHQMDKISINKNKACSYNELAMFFNHKQALFLLMMNAYEIKEGIFSIGSYAFSSKPTVIEGFEKDNKNNLFSNVYKKKNSYNFDITNVIMFNGERFSLKEFEKLIKEEE